VSAKGTRNNNIFLFIFSALIDKQFVSFFT
jgi:hypothetical protein